MIEAATLAARILLGLGVGRQQTIDSIAAEFPEVEETERVVDYAASQLERERSGHAAIDAEHDLTQTMHREAG